jgi:2-polyprenyl-6-methoxyphenol hydroxylase-like FAD-dependent oxidoreductase
MHSRSGLSNQPSHQFDIVIVGAGPVGLAVAVALHQAGFSVAIIDKNRVTAPELHPTIDSFFPSGCKPPASECGPRGVVEGKSHAVPAAPTSPSSPSAPMSSPASKWFALGADVLAWFQDLGFDLPYQPIRHLILSCQGQSPNITLDSQEAGEVFLTGVIHSHHLHSQGQLLAAGMPYFCPDSIKHWEEHPTGWFLNLESGQNIRTPLVIGADGGHSGVRAFFDPTILRCDFRQKAVVFRLDCVAMGWSYEHFFPHGSLAVLSLLDGKGAGIWIGPALDVAHLNMQQVIYDRLGIHSAIVGPISIFDVHGHWVGQKIFHRCVLIGDAAHAIHPIAGQGLNLGLRNGRLLVNHITERRRLGLDWGLGLGNLSHRWGIQTTAMQLGTTGLVHTLCGADPRMWWSIGGNLMRLGWARKWLIRTAAGKMLPDDLLGYIFRRFQ